MLKPADDKKELPKNERETHRERENALEREKEKNVPSCMHCMYTS